MTIQDDESDEMNLGVPSPQVSMPTIHVDTLLTLQRIP